MTLKLLELDHGLTRWEVEFIESLVKQLEAGVVISVRQRKKLHSIYEERLDENVPSDDDE